MPMVLIIMSIIMLAILLVSQSVVMNQRQITRYGYQLIARAAAKAAVDIAKEEIDSNLTYCGTPENKVVSDANSTVLYDSIAYKVTYQIEIYDGVCSGTGRNVRAIGRVYIPDISVTAAYVQDIRVRLVRSGLATESPGDLSPVAWYRADQASSVRMASVSTFNDTFNYSSRREETVSGGSASTSCSSSDLEFHQGNENSGEQRIGITFSNIDIPQGATITSAYIQFRSGGASGTGGTTAQLSQPLSTRIWAYDEDNKATFTCPNPSSQMTSTSGLTSPVDWAIPSWPTSGQSGSSQRTPSLVSQLQQIVNRSGWSSGNRMGFRFERISGSGLRNATTSSSHIRLVVSWQTSGGSTSQATNSSTVVEWLDQTSNNNDLTILTGSPTLRTNVLNSKQVVEFDNAMMSRAAFSPTLTDDSGMTAVAVMRPTTGGSGADDRFVNFINSSLPNDSLPPSANGAVRALMRSGSTNGITASVNGYTPQPINNALGADFSSSSWGIYAFTIGNDFYERFSRNGSPNSTYDGGDETSFSVDNLMLGGTSTGAGTYGFYGDMQLAELVVYDKILSCGEIRLLENYYRSSTSWNITSATYNCPLK